MKRMNKKGLSLYLGIIVGLFIMMVGFLFVNFTDSSEILVQNQTMSNGQATLPGLSCGSETNPNLTISDGQKLTCLQTELTTPYLIIMVLATAGGLIVGRLKTGK